MPSQLPNFPFLLTNQGLMYPGYPHTVLTIIHRPFQWKEYVGRNPQLRILPFPQFRPYSIPFSVEGNESILKIHRVMVKLGQFVICLRIANHPFLILHRGISPFDAQICKAVSSVNGVVH